MKSKIMPQKTIAVLFILAATISCNQPEEKRSSCEQLNQIDSEMLRLINQIEDEYKNNEVFLKAFKDAQIYWTQYRNRQVKAVFPLSPRKYDFDVGACKCELYRDLTVLRVKELRQWTDGVPQDTCAGTHKTKRD